MPMTELSVPVVRKRSDVPATASKPTGGLLRELLICAAERVLVNFNFLTKSQVAFCKLPFRPMARKTRAKARGDKHASRACPWSRREQLSLARAWGDVVRRPAAMRAEGVDAEDELFVEFQQTLAQCDGSDTAEVAPLPTRTKSAARAKMNGIVSSFKCIQEHLQHQQLACGDLRAAAARVRADWFALSKEQQLGILKKTRRGVVKSSFCLIERDVFELLETVMQDESPTISHVPDPHAKWSAIETRHLVQAWREELEANPTARPNAISMFQRFSEFSSENTRRRSIGFGRKLKLILKAYTAFLDSEQNVSTDATSHAQDRHAAGLPERFRRFTERQGQMRQPLLMDDDTIRALGEIKRMLDAVEIPDRGLQHVSEHDCDSSSDDNIQRYRIKKGAADEIDLVELQSCSTESEDEVRCRKRPRQTQVLRSPHELEVDRAAASASQGSVTTTVSIYSDEDSPRFGGVDDEVQPVPFIGSRGNNGCVADTDDFGRISAITGDCVASTNARQLSPARADSSGTQLTSIHDTLEQYHHQAQYMMLSLEQAVAKRNGGRDECMAMLQRFREESRRGRSDIIDEIRRIQLEQQRAQATILRTLESLGRELRAQYR